MLAGPGMRAVERRQEELFYADHDAAAYKIDVDRDIFRPILPKIRPICSDREVTDAKFLATFDRCAFQAALEDRQLDEA